MPNVLFKMSGRRKATGRYCATCQFWLTTHRASKGEEYCMCDVKKLPDANESKMEFPAIIGMKALAPRNL